MENFQEHYFNKKDLLEYAKEYEYIVMAHDKFLSNWKDVNEKEHYQFILCKNLKKKDSVINYLNNEKSFNYINWYPLKEVFFKNIMQKSYKCNYTIRNDWTIDERGN